MPSLGTSFPAGPEERELSELALRAMVNSFFRVQYAAIMYCRRTNLPVEPMGSLGGASFNCSRVKTDLQCEQ